MKDLSACPGLYVKLFAFSAPKYYSSLSGRIRRYQLDYDCHFHPSHGSLSRGPVTGSKRDGIRDRAQPFSELVFLSMASSTSTMGELTGRLTTLK